MAIDEHLDQTLMFAHAVIASCFAYDHYAEDWDCQHCKCFVNYQEDHSRHKPGCIVLRALAYVESVELIGQKVT